MLKIIGVILLSVVFSACSTTPPLKIEGKTYSSVGAFNYKKEAGDELVCYKPALPSLVLAVAYIQSLISLPISIYLLAYRAADPVSVKKDKDEACNV